MADITVTINVSDVSYRTWMATSYIGKNLVTKDGVPLIGMTELGPDQEDIFEDFMGQAANEILKLFLSRQGKTTGIPFEYDGTTVTYRFEKGLPALGHSSTLEAKLADDVQDALFTFVTILWFESKNAQSQTSYLTQRFTSLSNDISANIYRLHD